MTNTFDLNLHGGCPRFRHTFLAITKHRVEERSSVYCVNLSEILTTIRLAAPPPQVTSGQSPRSILPTENASPIPVPSADSPASPAPP
jgi:hypothetical protein